MAKKGCVEEGVKKMTKGSFTANEVAKIDKVSYRGPVAILKESNLVDMTEVLKNSKQFDMDRSLTKEEKLSKTQRAAAGQIQYGEMRHGGVGAFDFEDNNDDIKTVTEDKKVGQRATNSVSGKTFTEDIYSFAGATTLPSHRDEEEDDDSFMSSIESVVGEEPAEAEPRVDLPAEVHTPKRAELHTPRRKGKTVVDMSKMEKPAQTVDLEVDDMSLELSAKKQDPDDNKTNSETDTAAGKESLSNSQEERCFEVLEKRHENKFKNPKKMWRNYTTKKDQALRLWRQLARISKDRWN